jgi:TRAP-type C4-dicarboxylate transport system permease small subunit
MRRTLNTIYDVAGVLAALLIVAICLLVTAQVVANLATKLLGTGFALTIPSYSDFSGYFLAASSFLALAYTFKEDGHIRVLLVREVMPKRLNRFFDRVALLLAAATALYMTYYAGLHVLEAYEFGDTSPGIVPIPLYIPQATVFIGLLVFAISLVDAFLASMRSEATNPVRSV